MRRPIKVKEMICQSAPARRRWEVVVVVERGWWERRVPCSSRAWEGRVSSSSSSSSSSAREWRGGEEEDILVRGICEDVDERIDCGDGAEEGRNFRFVAGDLIGDFSREIFCSPHHERTEWTIKKAILRARVSPTVVFSTLESAATYE
jgi:hypothetical protein